MERQSTFGWVTAVDLFLVGAGGGVFFISFTIGLLNGFEPLAKIGAVCGPLLVLIGVFILLTELSTKIKFYRVFCNPSSWMSRGTWFITLFVLFGLAYSLPVFWFSAWTTTPLVSAIGAVAAIFSVLTTLYAGFLFGAVKRIPLWNTAALPVLFFFSSLCTGMAILLLIAPFVMVSLGDGLDTLSIVAIALMLMQSLVLAVFLGVTSQGGISAAESVRRLTRPRPIIGIIVVGLAIPLGLLSYYAAAGNQFVLLILAATLLLIGNFFLRYYILRAGVRLPVYLSR